MGLSTMRRQPLTIVSAHVDFQLSATRQTPSSPPHPPSQPMGAGGLKIEPAAACSRELILHAAPVSSTPSVRQPAEAARQTLLPCAGHLWPAAQRAPYKRHQVKSGYASPPLGARRQHMHSAVAREGKGQQGGGGGVSASASSVENNRRQWDVFGKQRLGSYAITPSCFLFPRSLALSLYLSLNFPSICPSPCTAEI